MKKKLPKSLKVTFIVSLVLLFVLLLVLFGGYIFYFYFLTVFTLCGGVYGLLTPPPAPPQIEYAEFPIKLVYEIDGTEYEIKETFICQYDGWKTSGGGFSKERVWKFVNGDGSGDFTIYDDGETEIYCEYLSAASYMGDEKYSYDYNPKLDIYATADQYSHRTMSAKELFEEFGITNIQFYPSEPIENSFSYLNYFR